jgi:putative PIN family toxin of toxin-antitoxin system
VYKVVFDTNVYLSAILFGGKPEVLLRLARSGDKRIELFTSSSILKEIAKVLSSNKFNWPEPRVIKVIRHIAKIAEVVEPKSTVSILKDKSDNQILQCALESKADFIVPGDKHLLDLGQYENIPILKPAQFLKLLEEEEKC